MHEKLVRRHPHVFGDAEARTAGRVRERWEEIKTEQEGASGCLPRRARIAPALLLRARKVQRRAAAVGFDWPDLAGPLAKVREELAELEAALDGRGQPPPETRARRRACRQRSAISCFAVVNVARRLNVDPELALRGTTRALRRRVERAEALAAAGRRRLARGSTLEEQDRYYETAKRASR